MLSVSNIHKRYAHKVLFDGASLRINGDERVGLVGPNGAGKTTLFKMILGEEEPDDGTVTLDKGVQVGYLPQESAPVGDETALEVALSIHPDFVKVRRRLLALGEGGATSQDGDGELHHRFADWDGHALEAKAKRIMAGLGFRESGFDKPARELSGGWVMRAHLARLLVQEPGLLMLDEPTNHLDLEALIWFQDYLRGYPGGILVISHDREFLNRLLTHVVEIRQRKLIRYKGNYDRFREQKLLADEQQQRDHDAQQAEIARLKELIARFGAKANKAAQAQSWRSQIDRMVKIDPPDDDSPKIHFRFPQPTRGGRTAITLKEIDFAYGSTQVYKNMFFTAERGHRTVLVGPNGAGKSTLLKLLAGALEPQHGTHELGYNTRSGYYAQYRLDTMTADNTVLGEAMATLREAGGSLSEQAARSVLGAFLFRGDDVFKKVHVLSGGEKSRLALVKLLLHPPNLLLMDEPTTHLDIPSIDALVTALKQFEGTLIFISHDVYFIKALSTQTVHVNAGVLTRYEGDYQYYLDRTAAISAKAGLTAASLGADAPAAASAAERHDENAPGGGRKDERRERAEHRQRKSREHGKWSGLVTRLEANIQKLEARQLELTAELEKPETYETPGRAVEINRELSDIQRRLPELNAEWESAATKLADLEK